MKIEEVIKQVGSGWDISTGLVQTETKIMQTSYKPTSSQIREHILKTMIETLQNKNWPNEILVKLKEVNWNIDVLEKLAAYAANDLVAMEKLGIGPNKGLLLMGPIGCGKTELMQFIRKYMKPGFRQENMYPIMQNFNIHGDSSLSQYLNGHRSSSTNLPINFFFDDLGIERTGMHYGTKVEIGMELIYMRHILFKKYGTKTHFSTNMNIEELIKNYLEISRSRLREMCNVIVFSKTAPDLRF